MASPTFRLPIQAESAHLVKAPCSGGAQSRSTSAGSAPSDGQGSSDLQKSPEQRPHTQPYPNDMSGLPEYDYPTPWSITKELQLPDVDYPVPLIVKNTFIDFDTWRAPSLEEFYNERQTQSCPASSISLPPGLEDLVEPHEVAANLFAAAQLVAAESKARGVHEAWMTELTETKAATLQMDHLLPSGLFDDIPLQGDDTQSFLLTPPQQPPAIPSSWQSPVAFDLLHAPSAFGTNWQSPMFAPALHAPVFDTNFCTSSAGPLQASRQAVVLDLMQALSSPFPAMQEDQAAQRAHFHADHLDTQAFSLPMMPTKDLAAPEAELGSPEYPTVGSQGHWLGVCKPCAFLHTKGCGNGVSCPFCHLCDKGAKKRRSKDKRAVVRGDAQLDRNGLPERF